MVPERLLEKDIEDILEKHHDYFIEPGLKFKSRQVSVKGGRADLLFVDRFGDELLVELKRGTVKREAIAQLIDYLGNLANENSRMRLMLIAGSIPANWKNALDRQGIEFKEYIERDYLTYLENNDKELLEKILQSQSVSASTSIPLSTNNESIIRELYPEERLIVKNYADFMRDPREGEKFVEEVKALFAMVQGDELTENGPGTKNAWILIKRGGVIVARAHTLREKYELKEYSKRVYDSGPRVSSRLSKYEDLLPHMEPLSGKLVGDYVILPFDILKGVMNRSGEEMNQARRALQWFLRNRYGAVVADNMGDYLSFGTTVGAIKVIKTKEFP